MRRQALVVGLGQFGMSLARSLANHGVEVIAVDNRVERTQEASVFVAQALAIDAQNEEALRRTAPQRRDICICAIGDESRESSIIATALLRQMGAPRVIARATDAVHERILRLVGAHEVLSPERAFGERLASRLAFRGIVDEIPLGADLAITELQAPVSFVGRTLSELALPRRFDVMVIAIRRVVDGHGRALLPDPADPLRPDDILVIVSRPGLAHRIAQES